MIKIDGVDIPRIEYIDPVDGKVSMLRVMQDGVQIWPSASDVVNTPTGIQLSEYEIVENIDWDYTKMYVGEGDNVNLVTLYFTGQDADITSVPAITDWVLDPFNVVNTVTVYTDRVELLMNTAFDSSSSVTISYTPGVNPLKDIDGILLTELNDQILDNLLEAPSNPELMTDPNAARVIDEVDSVGDFALGNLSTVGTDSSDPYPDGDNAYCIIGTSLTGGSGSFIRWIFNAEAGKTYDVSVAYNPNTTNNRLRFRDNLAADYDSRGNPSGWNLYEFQIECVTTGEVDCRFYMNDSTGTTGDTCRIDQFSIKEATP